jgi:hypothetical protein
MGKIGKIILIILAILIIIFGICFFVLTKSSVTTAYLNVEKGDVKVNLGEGWIQAKDGMELSGKHKIKTGPDGEASVILYESAIVALESSTEVTVEQLAKENTKMKQNGATWNKFTGLNGMTTLELETPNAVVTVRGTEYGITETEVLVLDGLVTVKNIATGKTVEVHGLQKAIIETLEIKDLTPEEIAILKEKKKRILRNLVEIRERLIEKNQFVIGRIKSAADIDEAGLRDLMIEMDEGRYDENILLEKTPVELDALDQFVALTKEIKKERNEGKN